MKSHAVDNNERNEIGKETKTEKKVGKRQNEEGKQHVPEVLSLDW